MSTAPVSRPRQAGNADTVLRLLACGGGASVVLLVSEAGDRYRIEEASADNLPGRAIRMPDGLIGDEPAKIAVSNARISVAWTEMCGARPDFLIAAPLPGRSLHLVSATDCDAPTPGEMAEAAALVARLLDQGSGLRHRQETSHRIAALVDSLPIPLVFIDSRTIEVFLNDRARRLLGVSTDIATDRAIAGALARLVSDAQVDPDPTLALMPTREIRLAIRHEDRHYDVESRWIDDERLSGRLWLFHDTTDERQMTRLKDELISTVSHELRTPLTSINGSLSLLAGGSGGALEPAAAKLVDIAHRNGERLATLINDLLDLDRLETGQLDLHREPADMALLLRDAIAQMEPYGRMLDVAFALDLPSHQVPDLLVDPRRMLQVFSNLLSNAAKFSPAGGTVRVRMREREDGVRISVIDGGPGISPAFEPLLFTRFAQDHLSPRTPQAGTGLGLAISRGIVDRHGGTLRFDRGTGVGATFHIDLPVRRETSEPE